VLLLTLIVNSTTTYHILLHVPTQGLISFINVSRKKTLALNTKIQKSDLRNLLNDDNVKKCSDIICVYKILFNVVDVDRNVFFKLCKTFISRSNTCGHDFKLYIEHYRINTLKKCPL